MASGHFFTTYRSDQRLVKTGWMRFWIGVLIVALVYLPFVLTQREIFGIPLSYTQMLGMSLVQVNFALVFVIAAVALNLLTGYTGLISIGSAGFFALGAFAGGLFGVQMGLAVPPGGPHGGRARRRGRRHRRPTVAAGPRPLPPAGHPRLPVHRRLPVPSVPGEVLRAVRHQLDDPSNLGWLVDTDMRWYFLLLVLAALAILATKNVLRTREGRAFVAIRDQRRRAAASAGVNLSKTKLKAFAFSSFLMSVAGVLYVVLPEQCLGRDLHDRPGDRHRGHDHHRRDGLDHRARCSGRFCGNCFPR